MSVVFYKNNQIKYKRSYNYGLSSYKYFLPSNIGDPRQVIYVKEKVYDPFFADPAVETDQQIRNPRKLHEFLSYDVLSRVQLNNIVLEVTVPGNSDLEVGHWNCSS